MARVSARGRSCAGDFDAGQFAVVADADLREAERVESIFGAFDLAQVLSGYCPAVFDARGEAGAGRLVGDGEAGLAGEGADFLLGQVGGGQGRERVVHRGGFLAGTEVAAVVEVHAIGEVGEAELEARGFHLGEELVLAMEAAVAVVANVVWVVEFAGLQDVSRDAVFGGEVERRGQFPAGQGGRVGDDGEHAVAENWWAT